MKTCPGCGCEQAETNAQCPGCGIIFEKPQRCKTPPEALTSATRNKSVMDSSIADVLLPVPVNVNTLAIYLKGLLLLGLMIWGAKFIFSSIESNYAGQSFMHLVNLPFHEAGHIVFRPLGDFLATLGGSLMQLIIPAVAAAVLLFKTGDAFGAAVAVWWLGQNFIDLAPYINDARKLDLILLGGVTGKQVADYHDWEYLLRHTGLLVYDHTIAFTAHASGAVLMLCAFVWAGLALYMEFRLPNEKT